MQQQHNYTRALQGFVIITVIIIIGILVGRWLGGLPDEQKSWLANGVLCFLHTSELPATTDSFCCVTQSPQLSLQW